MNLSLLLSKLGLSQSSVQDVTLLLVVVLISFIFGMFIGRYKLITILINIYVSFSLMKAVPEQFFTDYTYQLVFFLASIIILTLISKKLFEIYISGSGSGFMWRVFVMSFLEVIMLISMLLSIIPKKMALIYVSNTSYQYLASPNAMFLWMVAPLIFMFVIHKKLNR